MKKRSSLLILFLLSILFTLFLAPDVTPITSCTINSPPASTETNDDALTYNVSVQWGGGQNLTNVTIWRGTTKIGTNSTTNGTRTTTTTGDFKLGESISTLADGRYTITAECRNDSDTDTISSSINSSGVILIVDNVAPTCNIDILTTEIEPLGFYEVSCVRSRDTNTINTSTFMFSITDSYSRVVNKVATSGRVSFDGSDTELEGRYTATCSVADNARNNATCRTEEFEVRSADDVITPAKKLAESKQLITPKRSYLTASLISIGILVVILIVLVAMYYAKKGKK